MLSGASPSGQRAVICQRVPPDPGMAGRNFRWSFEGKYSVVYAGNTFFSFRTDGTPDCVSFCDDACEKPFRGRPAETIDLEIGDIAWYWRDDRIVPCLVAGLPLTDVRYRELARNLGRDLGLDGTDDSYHVYIAGWGHEHPACWRCTPYYGTISKRTLRRLDAARREEEAIRGN